MQPQFLVVVALGVSCVACKAGNEHSSSPPGGHTLVVDSCLACHSEELVEQQRLTPAQWAKVVKKMVGWGAQVSATDEPRLSAYLAATYGTDAGSYVPARIGADEAAAQLAARDDGQFAGGDVHRGRDAFTTLCAACHGPEGRGAIGVNLVDRPFLTRAEDFADTLRRGRGKMPAFATQTDLQIADLLAYLRGLR